MHLAVDKAGVVHRVGFHDFRSELPPRQWEDNKWACRPVELELEQYFNGERHSFASTLAIKGTDFQMAVWKKLQQIPYGETISYAELSHRIGCRGGARAVGNAVGKNPVSILIPCHRVVRTNGAIGFYARQTLPMDQGQRLKQFILSLEGCNRG